MERAHPGVQPLDRPGPPAVPLRAQDAGHGAPAAGAGGAGEHRGQAGERRLGSRPVTVRLTPAEVELLEQLGEGDLDRGLQTVLTTTRAVLRRIRNPQRVAEAPPGTASQSSVGASPTVEEGGSPYLLVGRVSDCVCSGGGAPAPRRSPAAGLAALVQLPERGARAALGAA